MKLAEAPWILEMRGPCYSTEGGVLLPRTNNDVW